MSATLLSPTDHGAGAARHFARAGRAAARLRPGRVVAYAWLLAGPPLAVLQADHAGLHERHELPPLFHWFRDTSLAVPFAALAVIVAALVVSRARPAGPGDAASFATAATWGLLASALFAALSLPLVQLHGVLFGVEVETGVTPLQHALGEAFTVFQIGLLLVPVALLAGVPWRDSRRPAPAGVATTDAADPVPSAAPDEPANLSAAARALDGADR